jgi:hypothetical protein
MSMKQIAKAVKKSKDEFENGTIVAWTSGGRFTYAAIKTPVGWFTTGSRNAVAAGFVEEVMSFEAILKVLRRDGTSDVRVIGLDDGTKVE